MKTKALRMGSVKTIKGHPVIPEGVKVKVVAYDDDQVIVAWQSEAPVWNKGTQPVTRTASMTRKDWDSHGA